MRADPIVPLLVYLPASRIDPLDCLGARGWVDPNEASEVTKSEKRTLNEIHCLQETVEPIKLWRQAHHFSKYAKLQNQYLL